MAGPIGMMMAAAPLLGVSAMLGYAGPVDSTEMASRVRGLVNDYPEMASKVHNVREDFDQMWMQLTRDEDRDPPEQPPRPNQQG